ncbi:MAG TPA: ClbS/DfsB family four-helix bundle protein [Candidatus Methylomirabilis sp.]|nr:ClbS/DfsB family four-helix bundle protein [Candidatus Methylomirabilis sp.]
MGDRDKVVRDADEAYGELRESVTGLDDGQLHRVWLGTWGVREILIHISGWHREMIPALQRLGRGEPAYPEGISYDDYDGWNARFVDAKKSARSTEVLAELEASHRGFMKAAEALSDEQLAAGAPARELFDGVGPAHYREHAAQIREWRRADRR